MTRKAALRGIVLGYRGPAMIGRHWHIALTLSPADWMQSRTQLPASAGNSSRWLPGPCARR